MLKRIFSNTRKQISRSGWSAWASIAVMALAFLVGSIFGGLAYLSNLYIHFIETRSNLLVFFNEGMPLEIVERLESKWKDNKLIKDITFTSEEEAYKMYSDYTARVQPEIYAVLKTKEAKTLPSSLDIQIWSLTDLNEVKTFLQKDIEEELAMLKVTKLENSGESDVPVSYPVSEEVMYKYSDNPGEVPITLKVDDESLDQLREVLYTLRIAGISVLVILFIVIFIFIFMTVEFRLFNQMEEIGVMQLVGGSLFFIRSPYILEGGFYGFVGSLISSIIIGSVLLLVFVVDKTSAISLFIFENFGRLPWPYVSPVGWLLIVLSLSLLGFIIGAWSSFMSIRRFIR